MHFRVIDKSTSKDITDNNKALQQIALHEDWAKSLIWCDMEGFLISSEGDLYLADECGNWVSCSLDRFEVKWSEEMT